MSYEQDMNNIVETHDAAINYIRQDWSTYAVIVSLAKCTRQIWTVVAPAFRTSIAAMLDSECRQSCSGVIQCPNCTSRRWTYFDSDSIHILPGYPQENERGMNIRFLATYINITACDMPEQPAVNNPQLIAALWKHRTWISNRTTLEFNYIPPQYKSNAQTFFQSWTLILGLLALVFLYTFARVYWSYRQKSSIMTNTRRKLNQHRREALERQMENYRKRMEITGEDAESEQGASDEEDTQAALLAKKKQKIAWKTGAEINENLLDASRRKKLMWRMGMISTTELQAQAASSTVTTTRTVRRSAAQPGRSPRNRNWQFMVMRGFQNSPSGGAGAQRSAMGGRNRLRRITNNRLLNKL